MLLFIKNAADNISTCIFSPWVDYSMGYGPRSETTGQSINTFYVVLETNWHFKTLCLFVACWCGF